MVKDDILYDRDQHSVSEKTNIVYKVIFQIQNFEWVSEDFRISSNKIKRSPMSTRLIKKIQICKKVKKSHFNWFASRASKFIENSNTLKSLRSDLAQIFPEIGYTFLPEMNRVINKKLQIIHKAWIFKTHRKVPRK